MLRYIWCQQTNIYTCFIFIHRFFSAGGLAAPLGVAAAATIGGAVGEAFLRVVHRLRWEKGLRVVFMISLNFYHPQRSHGKVRFLHMSVSHSVHGGRVYSSMHWAGTPRGQTPPVSRHPPDRHPLMGRHPPGRTPCVSQYALGQTAPRCIPVCIGADTPGCIPVCIGADTPPCVSEHALGQTPPPPMATAADGAHPTGMHSCLDRHQGEGTGKV